LLCQYQTKTRLFLFKEHFSAWHITFSVLISLNVIWRKIFWRQKSQSFIDWTSLVEKSWNHREANSINARPLWAGLMNSQIHSCTQNSNSKYIYYHYYCSEKYMEITSFKINNKRMNTKKIINFVFHWNTVNWNLK